MGQQTNPHYISLYFLSNDNYPLVISQKTRDKKWRQTINTLQSKGNEKKLRKKFVFIFKETVIYSNNKKYEINFFAV